MKGKFEKITFNALQISKWTNVNDERKPLK